MLTIVDKPVAPYVEWGLWIARCPQLWCVGIDHYGPGPNTGRIGGLRDDRFICPRCNHTADVEWPDNADDINFLLSHRPMPETRNWSPGETVADLLAENATHGVMAALEPNKAVQITTAGAFADRTILAAPALRAIGG